MAVMEEIRGHLSQGKSTKEIISLGYARGTVYRVAQDIRKGKRPNSIKPINCNVDHGFDSKSIRVSPAADSEVNELQVQLQRARLEAELARVRGDVKSVAELQRGLVRLQEWTVAMVSGLGQCVVRLNGNQVEPQVFEEFVRTSLANLRGP